MCALCVHHIYSHLSCQNVQNSASETRVINMNVCLREHSSPSPAHAMSATRARACAACWLGWARACWGGYLYRKSAFTLPDPTRLTTSLSTLTFSSCQSNIILLRVRVFLHDSYICNVVDEGLLAGPPPGQGGYYPQPPQQAYQGGGQPGYQPQPQPQVVYV